MTPADNTPDSASISKSGLLESDIEKAFIAQLGDLKYTIRRDIRDETSLHNNFREKFEALNRVKLTDAEFNRLLGQWTGATKTDRSSEVSGSAGGGSGLSFEGGRGYLAERYVPVARVAPQLRPSQV